VRRTYDEDAGGTIILLGFQDVTGHRAIELEKERVRDGADALLLLKEMLLREMQHRVLNSLQIVASILMLKARAVRSEESRQHLRDAHQRILSVAAVQQHLHSYGSDDLIAIGPYLKKLCESLSASIISEAHAASLQVWADDGAIRSGDAVNLGLIVTELVINALKYAFPDTTRPAIVTVRYKIEGARWMLSVSDNGVGCKDSPSNGLGTALVKSLARQLRAQVETTSSPAGLHVAITQTSADFVAGA
jgi:chemotaxis protein methyltransferase CheR